MRTRQFLYAAWVAALFATPAVSFQLPPAPELAPEGRKEFAMELDRLKGLLAVPCDKCFVEIEIARTYAAAGLWTESLHWLQKVAGLGIDPSREKLFSSIRNTREFRTLLTATALPPVSNSYPVATISEPGLIPESLAYDPTGKAFYIGNTLRSEVFRCRTEQPCEPFAKPDSGKPGYVLGVKLHLPSRTIWTTGNTSDGASLRQYSLQSGALIRTHSLLGAHVFNDIAVARDGSAFVTDTKEGSVYQFSVPGNDFHRLGSAHLFTSANGIALSPDERTLFVSSFPQGIAAIDLLSQTTRPILHSAGVCLAYIDGLYALPGSLIAIQNGPMKPRIVRVALNPNGRSIAGMKTLEQGNPLSEGLTTGSLVDGRIFYTANTRIDSLHPLKILAIPVTAGSKNQQPKRKSALASGKEARASLDQDRINESE